MKPPISSDWSILSLESFWLVDPDVEGKFLPSGQLTIHYVGGTAVQLGEVAIRFHGMTLEALWPHEVNQLLKETTPLSLTNLRFHDQIHSYGVAATRKERDLQLGP